MCPLFIKGLDCWSGSERAADAIYLKHKWIIQKTVECEKNSRTEEPAAYTNKGVKLCI